MDTNGNLRALLLKDLCSRLPYGVICKLSAKDANVLITEKLDLGGLEHFIFGTMDVKPYLRPMSSMTQKEEEDLKQIIEIELNYLASGHVGHTVESAASSTFEIDFYNSHHFDFRGLIPMGLALEAPKDMYKTE